jgi:hypothetical protein
MGTKKRREIQPASAVTPDWLLEMRALVEKQLREGAPALMHGLFLEEVEACGAPFSRS